MDTDPPLPPPSRWWTQLHSLFFRREKKLTKEETSALMKPFWLGILTYFAVSAIVLTYFYLDRPPCNVSFSVESVSVSPYPTTWHVDFLVKDPSSRCPINYDGDDVYAKIGPTNAAVLRTFHTHRSRGQTSFSVDLATSNQSDVVAASPRVFELQLKLGARKIQDDQIGRFDIRCQMIGHENIKCLSSFKELKSCC
ncbi:uncharacterized protein LOC18019047 [Eutrema salsugineum]|uniref:uncharacterized protein LOC18019047 n=1 Tax=Eutrema salsugineum TaxID=72664 RepID=UPI000CED6801|nr:uncharacterized protein LOC18019047 [Eutrema salsugineum]